MELTHQESQFLNVLNSVESIHASEIAYRLNIREVDARRIRHDLQVKGYNICSGHFGYSLKKDFSKTKENYKKRAMSLLSLLSKNERRQWLNENYSLFEGV